MTQPNTPTPKGDAAPEAAKLNDHDRKLIDEFDARHADKSDDEKLRLALDELPADVWTRLTDEVWAEGGTQ